MKEYVAVHDHVIPGIGVVREGERVTLSDRAAKYLALKGRIAPPPASPAEKPKPRPKRPRK